MAGKLLMIKFVKMKKKIVFAVATGFFAVATVFNMNILQGNSAGDVSLDAIAVMAQAQSEGGSGGGGHANVCDPIWTVTWTGSIGTDTKAEFSCTTGGSYVCPACFWK
ncbi:MAG TPA: hypothetical protein VFD77_06870 [Brumimicrobium sp.]|nr:hypothetical protein [Brumimicrobium sp.]